MSGPNRILPIAKWVGMICCILILAAWFSTIPLFGKPRLSVIWHNEHSLYSLGFGGVTRACFPASTPPFPRGLTCRWLTETPPASRGWGGHGFRWIYRSSSFIKSLDIPLWIFLLPVGVATLMLWGRDRKHHKPGHCRKCGYNLTGNESGLCPECGLAVAAI